MLCDEGVAVLIEITGTPRGADERTLGPSADACLARHIPIPFERLVCVFRYTDAEFIRDTEA